MPIARPVDLALGKGSQLECRSKCIGTHNNENSPPKAGFAIVSLQTLAWV